LGRLVSAFPDRAFRSAVTMRGWTYPFTGHPPPITKSRVRSHQLRICTWNLDHARGRPRDVDRVRLIDESNCDVLVLIETCDRIRPTSSAYAGEHSRPRPHCPEGERWTSVWTRLPVLKRITTIDPLWTVALLLSYENEDLLTYGTVLPWQPDVGDAHADPLPRNWQEHRRVVEEQTQEWRALRAQFPDGFLAIAGDR
jgi:hypothetical protein